MKPGGWFLIGGGLTTLVAALWASKKSSDTTSAIEKALAPVNPSMPSSTPRPSATFDAVLTHYWPFKENMSAKERLMEGGVHDTNSQPLYTVEDFLAGKSDHVSISGDDAIFPYGQKVLIPWGNRTLVGRVTDTGGHFRGLNKVYRVEGREPLDVCVFSAANKPPNKRVTVTLIPGDDWAHKKRTSVKTVATARFKDQTVLTGEDAPDAHRLHFAAAEAIVGAYYEALQKGL